MQFDETSSLTRTTSAGSSGSTKTNQNLIHSQTSPRRRPKPHHHHPATPTKMAITASLSLLPRADGSANFKSGLTTVIASVNGPMEVRPRDELPDKTFIEVIVRPAVGVGGKPPLPLLLLLLPGTRH